MDLASLLLCAGRGERLRPLTDVMPKPAVPLLDVPLAGFGLTRLVRAAAPVMVNAGYLAPGVVAALKSFAPGSTMETMIESPEPFGTAGTLAALKHRVADPIVVHNGDLLTDVSLADLLRAHRHSGAAATLVVRKVDRGADLIADNGVVTTFIDRRVHPGEPGWMYEGVAAMSRRAVRAIPDRRPLGLGESVFAPMAVRGELHIYPHDGYALDVGTIGRYLEASVQLLHGAGPLPPVPWPGRVIEVTGGVAYVGPEAEVEPASLGPDAIVLRGARIGAAVRIDHAVVWPGERVDEGRAISNGVWLRGELVRA